MPNILTTLLREKGKIYKHHGFPPLGRGKN